MAKKVLLVVRNGVAFQVIRKRHRITLNILYAKYGIQRSWRVSTNSQDISRALMAYTVGKALGVEQYNSTSVVLDEDNNPAIRWEILNGDTRDIDCPYSLHVRWIQYEETDCLFMDINVTILMTQEDAEMLYAILKGK